MTYADIRKSLLVMFVWRTQTDTGNIAKVSGRAGFIQGTEKKSYISLSIERRSLGRDQRGGRCVALEAVLRDL